MKYLVKTKKDIKYKNKVYKKDTVFEIDRVCDTYIYISHGIHKIKIFLKDYEDIFYDQFV